MVFSSLQIVQRQKFRITIKNMNVVPHTLKNTLYPSKVKWHKVNFLFPNLKRGGARETKGKTQKGNTNPYSIHSTHLGQVKTIIEA